MLKQEKEKNVLQNKEHEQIPGRLFLLQEVMILSTGHSWLQENMFRGAVMGLSRPDGHAQSEPTHKPQMR